MQKQDMSANCGFKDMEMWYKVSKGEITDQEYEEYWNENCSKCIHMCEICMCGED